MNSQQFISQDYLKTIYRSQDKITQLIEGLDEIPEQSLKDYYVKLQMIVRNNDSNKYDTGYETVSGEKREIELDDLFEKIPEDKSSKIPKRLLIIGGAGVGKSTMMQYISFKWSSNELWQNNFDYIYRVSLKTLLNPEWKYSPWAYEAKELNDSLLKCLVHYTLTFNLEFKNRKNITTTMLPWDVVDRKKILLLLDGYDEVAHLQNQSDFKAVMDEIFEFENLILTSRPNAVKNEMRMSFDRIIESTGLDQKGIDQYFDRYFTKEHENKKQELRRFLDTRIIIKEICKIPVNIAMLCYIWLYSESNQRLKEVSNISTLYQEMFDHLGLRYLQKKFETTNSSKNQGLEGCSLGRFDIDEIRVLTHVAYKAMTGGGITNENEIRTETLIIKGAHKTNGMIDLHDKDGISLQSSINYLADMSQIKNLIQDKVTIRHLYKYGLLKIEGASTNSAKDPSDTVLQKLNFSFIHLTFQEFCTASYLKERLQKGDDHERNQICQFLSEHRNEPRYAMTLKFLAGIITDDQNKDNDIVVKLFWDAMICNVDGILELGIEAKTSLMLSLLGEAVTKKDVVSEIDSRIPNKEQIKDLIDAIVLKDILPFYKQLQETSYISENIKEGVLRALLTGTQTDNALIMKDILTRSEGVMKNIIENMLQEILAQPKVFDTYKENTLVDHLIDLAVNFIGKINEDNTSKENYRVRVMQGLSRAIRRLVADPKQNIQFIEKAITGMNRIIHEIEVVDEKCEFRELLENIFLNYYKLSINFKKVYREAFAFVHQAFSKIRDQQYDFSCMLGLSNNSKFVDNGDINEICVIFRRKEYFSRFVEYFVNDPLSIPDEMIDMMFERIEANLAIEICPKVALFLPSDDLKIQKSAISAFYQLVHSLPHTNMHLAYFRKFIFMFLEYKNKYDDFRKKCGCILNCLIRETKRNKNYDLAIQYIKEILNLIPNKTKIIDVRWYLIDITELNPLQEKKIWKEIESCLEADQSDEREEITTEKPRKEDFGEIQLCPWKLKVFEILKAVIDKKDFSISKHEKSSQNPTSFAESSSSKSQLGAEKSFAESYEEAKSLLNHESEDFRMQGIYLLKELVLTNVKNEQESVERINQASRDICPLMRDQSENVIILAGGTCLELITRSKNFDLGCQWIQNLINFIKGKGIEGLEYLYTDIKSLENQELNIKSLDIVLTSYQEETTPKQIALAMKCSFNILTELIVEIEDPDFASHILQRWIDILKKCECENLIQENCAFVFLLCDFAKDHELISYVCGQLLSFLENNDGDCGEEFIEKMEPARMEFFYSVDNELTTRLAEKLIQNFIDDPPKFKNLPHHLIHLLNYSKNEELVAKVWDLLMDFGAPAEPSKIQTEFMKFFVLACVYEKIDDSKRKSTILERFKSYLKLDDLEGSVKLLALEFLIIEGTILFQEDRKQILEIIKRNFEDFCLGPTLQYKTFQSLFNLVWDAVQIPDLSELIEELFMLIKKWILDLSSDLEDSIYSLLAQKIAELTTSKKTFIEFISSPNQPFRKYLADYLAESFKKLTKKLNNVRRLLKDKNLDVDVIEKNLFNGEMKKDLKERIRLQIETFKQTNTEECFNNLISSVVDELNFIGNRKSYELIGVSLRMIGYENFSTEELSQKKLADSAKDLLELQVEYINSEGLQWLKDNLEELFELSRESKPFIKKIYHKLLKDFEIASLEEELIIKLVNFGLTTSTTRNSEIIFEGKKYKIKGKNTELVLERIARALLDQEKDALSIQYKEHEPIFRKSVKIGIREASSDIKKIFSLIDKSFELTTEKLFFTKLSAQKGQERCIMEQRNHRGDHVIYDLGRLKFININLREIEKERESLFGNYDPTSPLQYVGQSKELERDIGYQIISAGSNWRLEFENVLNNQLGAEKIYLQQELLNKGSGHINSLLISELDKKLEDNQRSLQNELDLNKFLNQDQKKKLTKYYKAFLGTFTEVFTTAQLIESGQVVVDAGSTSKIGLVLTLATFVPVIGSNLSTAIDSIDKLLRSQEMINSARRMKLLASSPVELEQLVGKSARAIIQDKAKQNLITKSVEGKEDSPDLLDESVKDKLTDKLKEEIMKLAGKKLFGEVYNTAAEKMGNSDAKELIHKWINKEIDRADSAEDPIERLKRQFVEAIIPKDKLDNMIKSGGDSFSCLSPCRGCQLF